VTIRSTLAAWRSLTIGPDLNSLTERVADDEILGLSYEGFDIRVSNAFVYDVSAAGEADLYRWKKAAHAAALASASTSTPSSTM